MSREGPSGARLNAPIMLWHVRGLLALAAAWIDYRARTPVEPETVEAVEIVFGSLLDELAASLETAPARPSRQRPRQPPLGVLDERGRP